MDLKWRIRDWPADQRPRERVIELGAENLFDAELLAIILRVGNTQTTAIGLAQRLLKECGGFRGLDSRSLPELCTMPGFAPAKAEQFS